MRVAPLSVGPVVRQGRDLLRSCSAAIRQASQTRTRDTGAASNQTLSSTLLSLSIFSFSYVLYFRLRGYVGINLELIFNSGARRAKLSHHDVTPESRISDELGDSAPDIGARGSFHVFGGIFELPCFIL